MVIAIVELGDESISIETAALGSVCLVCLMNLELLHGWEYLACWNWLIFLSKCE